MTLRLCLWSGPRSVSTALMYAFAQRDDTQVVDEPLYAHYLRVSGAPHPGRDAVLRSRDADGERVIREQVLGSCARPVLFMKHMAHHLIDVDWQFLDRTVNVLLVREPESILVSLSSVIAQPSAETTGLPMLRRIFEYMLALGQAPLVIDARVLLGAPATVLHTLCTALNLPYTAAMLSWQAGGRPEDGVWARHWYQAVHCTTGFEAPGLVPDVPQSLRTALAVCRPHYEALRAHAIGMPNRHPATVRAYAAGASPPGPGEAQAQDDD